MPPLENYVSNMPTIEEKEVEGKGLKILTPNKLFTRLPVLLAQMKAGTNRIRKSGKRIYFIQFK